LEYSNLPSTAPAPDGPRLTTIQTISGIAFAGQTGKVISGRTTRDAVAIAVRFADAGSGYWIQPLGVADLLNGGELTFELRIDFSETAPLGNQKLEFVAIAADYYAIEQVVLDKGPLIPALAASSALPSLARPVVLDGRVYRVNAK